MLLMSDVKSHLGFFVCNIDLWSRSNQSGVAACLIGRQVELTGRYLPLLSV
jgi:hypothetical protein